MGRDDRVEAPAVSVGHSLAALARQAVGKQLPCGWLCFLLNQVARFPRWHQCPQNPGKASLPPTELRPFMNMYSARAHERTPQSIKKTYVRNLAPYLRETGSEINWRLISLRNLSSSSTNFNSHSR